MGIFDALTTSVAGLQSTSYALQNISGNIANSQTTAFKGTNTSFLALVPDTGTINQPSGSVLAQSSQTLTVQGSVTSASVSTYMAINGAGFFTVQKPESTSDNNPVFAGVNMYTRRGDFTLDKSGYLVNGAGYYLEGVPIDSTTGNPVGSTPQVLQFQNNFLPSQVTSQITYNANLASTPHTEKYSSSVANSDLLNPADFGTNPEILGTQPPPYSNNSVSGTAKVDLAGNAIAGTTTLAGAPANSATIGTGFAQGDTVTVNGTVITFTANGGTDDATHIPITDTISQLLSKVDAITGNTTTPSTVTNGQVVLNTGTANNLTLTSTNSSALAALGFSTSVTLQRNGGGTTGTGTVVGSDNQTFLNESVSGGAVTAYDAQGAPVNVQFRWAKTATNTWNMFYQVDSSASGSQVAWQNVGTNFTFNAAGAMSPTIGQLTLNNMTVGSTTLGTVKISFGSGGLTQYADSNGDVQVNDLEQNGYAAGQLQSVSVDDQGRVVGAYSNGRNIPLAQVSIATFNGSNFLQPQAGGAYSVTSESGPAIYGNGGTVSGSSLEASNVDIADEFTHLIVTQQAYSANTKVMTTANQMVQSLLDVIR